MNPAVDPNTETGRLAVFDDPARSWQESLARIFRVDTELDRMPVRFDTFERKRIILGDGQLGLHEVYPGHHLGDRVLDLEPGVHLEEIEVAIRVDQELADLVGEANGRGLFDELLVTTLDGAVSFAEEVTCTIGVDDDLGFDMPGSLDVLLDVDGRVPEIGFGFPLGTLDGCFEFRLVPDYSQTLSATSCRRLDCNRVSEISRHPLGFLCALQRVDGSRNHRNTGRLGCLPRSDFVSHRPDGPRWGADPDEPGLRDRFREIGVLGQEAISGMDRLGLCLPGYFEDPLDVEIRLRGRCRADIPCFVGELDVQRISIQFRVDGDRSEAHLLSRADDPDGDLTAVGNEHGLHGRHGTQYLTTGCSRASLVASPHACCGASPTPGSVLVWSGVVR